ncbi:NAD-dependent epimerase/dehydratase family protein [Falsiroseomonas sp. HW251]|uniref:NAD-dependent epimerase/dehydratase family protein n=1 Tax=Falsiroseomonas sp. HW251 TaxID=3390998 RepID=UPI003D31B11A
MAILVTGAAGFIGHAVAEALHARGSRVVGTDAVLPEDPAFAFVQADLADAAGLAAIVAAHDVDAIVHCGAISGPMLARDRPDLVVAVNIGGTTALLEQARRRGMARFVFCSSAQAYGDTGPAPVGEDSPFNATDMYGASKAACDLVMRAYRVQHGLSALALRISYAYGPGRRTACAVRTMLADALAGRPTRLDWGCGHERAYLFRDDAVGGVIAALDAPASAQPFYNLASTEARTMDAIAADVRALLPQADIALGPGPNPLNYHRDTLDITAAARDLGWRPRFDLKTGLVAYLDWMKARPADRR